jgi:CRP-like cAMP-binding protein
MLIDQVEECYSPWISAQNRVWESILNLGNKHTYCKGSIIIGGGQPINDLYYLHVGQVKYSTTTREGNLKILWYLDNGNIFGAAPFFEGRPARNYNAITTMEKCEVYTFSRICFHDEIVANYPRLLSNLIQSMANRIFLALNRGGDLDSLRSRVCKILFYIVQRENNKSSGKVVCSTGISQQELAFILGVHRVTLNSIITQLKHEGIIGQISKRNLVINNTERLLEYAQD